MNANSNKINLETTTMEVFGCARDCVNAAQAAAIELSEDIEDGSTG